MNNHSQDVAKYKGYLDGRHGIPNRNPYKSRTGKYRYNEGYRLGEKIRSVEQLKK